MKELLFFEPICKELVWGKEYWTIAAHESGDCKVSEGSYAGMTLTQLWDNHRELFNNMEGECFPLLVKVIDAKLDLSVQVHPDNNYAAQNENGSYGKSECWYIMDSTKQGGIILGHNAKSLEEAGEMIAQDRWGDFLKKISIRTGNFIQIDPGTIHSICGGTTLTEIQQNSDITYRLYDYGRLVNGKPRELHIDKSLDVIRIPDRSHENVYEEFPQGEFQTDYYRIRKINVNTEETFVSEGSFQIVSVVEGEGEMDGHKIAKGDSLIIPHGYGEFHVNGTMILLLTSL